MMSKDTEVPEIDPVNDASRIAIMKRLFQRMSTVLDLLIDGCEANNDFSPKLLVSKLLELQSVHFAVLKAQEAFLEKQTPTQDDTSANSDDLRNDIGGKLDRIRDAIAAEEVSEGAR